jgi:hypothetical protein
MWRIFFKSQWNHSFCLLVGLQIFWIESSVIIKFVGGSSSLVVGLATALDVVIVVFAVTIQAAARLRSVVAKFWLVGLSIIIGWHLLDCSIRQQLTVLC